MNLQFCYRIVHFLLLISFFLFSNLPAQSVKFEFEHITADDGLSHSFVNDVIKDKNGFIWIATDDGLNRYDGVDFKIFRNEPGNPYSLSHNYTFRLLDTYVNGRQIIWVGTFGGGLNLLDVETERFINWYSDEEKIKTSSREPAFCSVLYESESKVIKMWYTNTAGILKDFTIDYVEVSAAEGIENVDWDNTEFKTVLSRGKEGEWDCGFIGIPTVIYHAGLYRMWYNGSQGGLDTKIGYAESEDGINWEKHPGNPVLVPGGKGSWPEVKGLLYPNVVHDGENYHIWYSGWNEGWQTAQIGHAVSADGIHWTKDEMNPVIPYGEGAAWDEHLTSSPMVRYEDGIFRCWYIGWSSASEKFPGIGYAVSRDGTEWEKIPEANFLNKAGDSNISHSSVIHDGEEYLLFYTDGNWYNWDIHVASSEDGIYWNQQEESRTFNKFYNCPTGNNVHSLFADSGGAMWMGCWGPNRGVNKIDFLEDLNFQKLLENPFNYDGWKISHFLQSVSGSDIEQDRYGNIWIAGNTQGIYHYNSSSGQFARFQLEKESSVPSTYNTYSVFPEENYIWAGMGNGDIVRLEFDFTDPTPSLLNQKRFKTRLNGIIKHIVKVSDNKFLLNSAVGGIGLFNKITGNVEYFSNSPSDQKSLGYGEIGTISVDSSGFIWICSEGGLNKFNPNKKKFRNFVYEEGNPNAIQSNYVSSLIETEEKSQRVLWIGTRSGGLTKISRRGNIVKHYKPENSNPNSLSHLMVRSLYEDREGFIWIGTGNLLQKLDPNTDRFMNYPPSQTVGESKMSGWHFDAVFEDQRDQIWIGSFKGYEKYNREKEVFDFQGGGRVTKIFAFKDFDVDEIWIATDNIGLLMYNDSSGIETTYPVDIEDPEKLGSKVINTLFGTTVDGRHVLWIGTKYGLYSTILHKNKSRNPDELKFKRYTVEDGLPNNIVTSITDDDNANLWIGTNRGLSKFTPSTGEFRNYDKGDGLPSNEFVMNSVMKSNSGELFFGTKNGLTSFFPDSIVDNTEKPNIVLTGFRLFNKPVKIDPSQSGTEEFHLKKQITYLDTLFLSYNENYFSFEFAALDYHNPKKNRYAYLMENFESDWNFTGSDNRSAHYTNVEPGEYSFKVKGTNNDGYWSDIRSLVIIITPPWWETNWAYLGYIIIVMILLYVVWSFQVSRINLKHAAELEHLEAEKYREIDQMKSRFFANISHEFRTPLTLILGPIERMLSKARDMKEEKDLSLVRRNARRLYNLINQLLDLSKLESNKFSLKVYRQNIVPFLKGLVMSFSSLAERKNILLKVTSEKEEFQIYFDKEVLSKIINNLVSNAFKFTERGGRIDIAVKEISDPVNKDTKDADINRTLSIVVTDNGIGIPKDMVERIFERFYRVDEHPPTETEGTGIGLSLTKEMVELHKGKITVTSEEKRGTSFFVSLPMNDDAYTENEISEREINDEDYLIGSSELEILEKSESENVRADGDLTPLPEKPIILVVEDNPDVRQYIKDYIYEEYEIAEAVNGSDGLEKAFEIIPDLILSDIMMPEMNGVELCSKLKNDERTSHIPVILLTAKASGEDKINGLETGADDYIMKPFDAKELLVRIKNLIEGRKRIREHFRKEGLFEINDQAVNSVDKVFLQKVIAFINDHISDTNLNIDILADEMALSRSQLYRKFSALCNESPSDFIRRIRLSRAAKLIEQNFGNISEIAMEVGFTNPGYFSKCFREQFKKSPKEYTK